MKRTAFSEIAETMGLRKHNNKTRGRQIVGNGDVSFGR